MNAIEITYYKPMGDMSNPSTIWQADIGIVNLDYFAFLSGVIIPGANVKGIGLIEQPVRLENLYTIFIGHGGYYIDKVQRDKLENNLIKLKKK